MATYQELRARSQQVRDEQNIGGNTALRVGQLLMDIVKYFNDNDAAASEYLQQHFAMVNDGTHLLNWQQSPIVILHTMGETYDDGDFSSLSQGENYYRNGFIVEANGQGGGINGETPKVNVLYVNLANDTLYTWNGSSFDAITSGGGGSISGDDILKNAYYLNGNLVLVFDTENGDKTVSIPVNFDASNYVPTSRTVNGKALSNNITLSQSDIPGLVAALAAKVGYSDDEWLQVKAGAMQAATAVPNTTTVNGKRLNDNITIQMADIPGLLQAIANAGSGAVSVTTNQDGTFVIHVGETDYTINLNHTHEGMVKLEKVTEATLPQTLADDTIYVQVDNLTTPTEIEALHIFGLEFTGGGGAAPGTPRLTSPSQSQISNGIDIGNTTSGVATYLLNIKARDLTQSLLVEWGSGSTGYSFDTSNLPTGVTYDSGTGKLTITKEAACGINGVDIPVVYTGSDTDEDAEGTIGISSSSVDGINVEVTLVANKVTYEDLAGVKLTGTQWLQTDYYPNANTEFVLRCKLEANAATEDTNHGSDNLWSCTPGSSNKKFYIIQMAKASGAPYNPYGMTICNENKINDVGSYQTVGTTPNTYQNFLADPLRVFYTKGTTRGTFGISADNGTGSLTHETVLKTTTMENALKIGINGAGDRIYSLFDLTIYSLVFTEGGNEVRHWVPKLKNGTTPGLYDTITGSFISSETSTELVPVTNP